MAAPLIAGDDQAGIALAVVQGDVLGAGAHDDGGGGISRIHFILRTTKGNGAAFAAVERNDK